MIELNTAAEEGRPYALALLDYQMPEIDGGELARQIRTKHASMIYVLSCSRRLIRHSSVEERISLSIHASITKPLRRSRLFDAIDEALDLNPGERAPASATALTDLAAARIAEANQQEPSTPLKRNKQVKSTVRAVSQPAEPVATDSPDQKALKVLVVEDNPINQMVIQELMLAAGHSVVVAENGVEALKRLEEEKIELILMDCQMPVMDGYEATIRIRELEAENGSPRLPIIAVTANAIMGDRERCLYAGMDDYVTKPIDSKQLEAAIYRHTHGTD